MGEEQQRRNVRRSSDQLLAAVDELKAVERRKRQTEMSTPEFHRLADEVFEKARDVWRTAADEDVAGDALSEPQGVTTEEQPPDGQT